MPAKCPQCGTPLPAGALAGLCPACLLKAGTAADTITDAKQPAFNPPSVAELATKFPQLQILELIGKGGMGAIYKARQTQLDRIVALKILPPGIGDDPAFAERFAREAKALAKLNHPGIVTIYDFGRADGLFYFFMEYVDGVNLRQLLHAGRVSPREALAIVPQICDALQFAHDQGIVHRDIKPENILLDRRGRVKVADFGLAKIVGGEVAEPAATGQTPAGSPVLTESGKIMGTPQYMAPEQKDHPEAVDHRADIYALGVVFYQMLTGELPGKRIEPPSSKVHIDVRLDEVVLRALEKKPELRYQQASVLKTEVETIVSESDPANVREPKGWQSPSSGWGYLVGLVFGTTFTSRTAFNLANFSALGFLGCLGFLGYVPVPGMEHWFGLTGLFGLFGLIGFAFMVETIHRIQHGLPLGRPAGGSATQKSGHLWRIIVAFLFILTAGILTFVVARNFIQGTGAEKSFYVGQAYFPKGDSIKITSVERDENHIAVKGHYQLVSEDKALLAFTITTPGFTTAWSFNPQQQATEILRGSGDFELVHPHPVSGLPHINMYDDNGKPFAELYFGTKAEAAEESKLDLTDLKTERASPRPFGQRLEEIVNRAPTTEDASAETWSPTFAPGERPDIQKIRDEIKTLMEQQHYEEALQRQIWYFNHALEFGEANPVRVSFGIMNWGELGRRYLKAKQALIDFRDRDARKFSEGNGYPELFLEEESLNRELGDDEATVTLLKTILQKNRKLAGQCYGYVEDLLIQRHEHRLCLDCVGDPQAGFDSARLALQSQRESQQRMAELRQQHPQPPLPHPPGTFTPPDMGQLATNNFVAQVCKLVEILVATGHRGEAEKIRDQAMAVLDDSRLKSAVSDAEEKIQAQKSASGADNDANSILVEQPPVVVETYPLSGASDVPPGETEIRVRFSKPMTDGSWSWSTAWENSTPESLSGPHYLDDHRTCVMKVRLEPGKFYGWWLNSGQFKSFMDRAGQPAVPYLLTFQTKSN